MSVELVLVDRLLAIDQHPAISLFESLDENLVNIKVIATIKRNVCAIHSYTEISQS